MTAPRETPQSVLTLQQAARALCVSVKTLRGHVRDGNLPYISLGRGAKRRRMGFDPQDIAAFIARRKEAPCPSINPRNRHSGTTISGSTVIGFTARLARQTAATRNA